jgi:hypothetical protein
MLNVLCGVKTKMLALPDPPPYTSFPAILSATKVLLLEDENTNTRPS